MKPCTQPAIGSWLGFPVKPEPCNTFGQLQVSGLKMPTSLPVLRSMMEPGRCNDEGDCDVGQPLHPFA